MRSCVSELNQQVKLISLKGIRPLANQALNEPAISASIGMIIQCHKQDPVDRVPKAVVTWIAAPLAGLSPRVSSHQAHHAGLEHSKAGNPTLGLTYAHFAPSPSDE
jgi:hypothetical protein